MSKQVNAFQAYTYKFQRDYQVNKNCYAAGCWSVPSKNTYGLAFIFTFPAGSLVLCGHYQHSRGRMGLPGKWERQSAELQTDKPGKVRIIGCSFQKPAGFSLPRNSQQLAIVPLSLWMQEDLPKACVWLMLLNVAFVQRPYLIHSLHFWSNAQSSLKKTG